MLFISNMYNMIGDFILFEKIASIIHETHQHGIEIPLHDFTKTIYSWEE